jgi:hypothetical protein
MRIIVPPELRKHRRIVWIPVINNIKDTKDNAVIKAIMEIKDSRPSSHHGYDSIMPSWTP